MDSISQHNEDTQANRLIKLGMRLGVSAALHPFEYAKVLIQVNTLMKSGLDVYDVLETQINDLFFGFRCDHLDWL